MSLNAILDVDGTLVDTNYHHALAWHRALHAHGHPVQMWKVHRHIGMGGDQILDALIGSDAAAEQGDAIRAAEAEAYGELIGEVEPMEGARELIDDWTTSDDVESTKPDPDLVLAALNKAGDDNPAVMVGDSVWDVKAAKAAGVPTLAVLTGGFSEAELRDAGASQVVESIAELDFEPLFAESSKN
jgi:phosphoglycolate phosphatase-like HAD superfamily hydrolase